MYKRFEKAFNQRYKYNKHMKKMLIIITHWENWNENKIHCGMVSTEDTKDTVRQLELLHSGW